MKIILHVVIACLIILSSNALHLSSSRRASTEAAAYMRLTSLLGYTNGYKALAGFGSKAKTDVFECRLVIRTDQEFRLFDNSQNQISKTKEYAGIEHNFKFSIKTIKNNSYIESLNAIDLPQISSIPEAVRDAVFIPEGTKFALKLDPLRILGVSNLKESRIVEVEIKDKNQTIHSTFTLELYINNFNTAANSKPTEVNETSTSVLVNSLSESKKQKLSQLRQKVGYLSGTLNNLKSAINIKIMYLRKEEATAIYQGEINRLNEDKQKCIKLREKLQKEYEELETKYAETRNIMRTTSIEITTCNQQVEKIQEDIKIQETKINTDIEAEKTRLTKENQENYTHLFYWLEASYFYRLYTNKMVETVNDVKQKFSESNIMANSLKLSEAFYPLPTDLTFLKQK